MKDCLVRKPKEGGRASKRARCTHPCVDAVQDKVTLLRTSCLARASVQPSRLEVSGRLRMLSFAPEVFPQFPQRPKAEDVWAVRDINANSQTGQIHCAAHLSMRGYGTYGLC